MSIKKDFPIFTTHPNLVYLDSIATSQKPAMVIDGVANYLRSSYANIHRGSYEISEKLYEDSKKIVAKHIGAESYIAKIFGGLITPSQSPSTEGEAKLAEQGELLYNELKERILERIKSK